MTIQIDDKKNIRIISLDRPKKLNAITLEMATELNKAIQNTANDLNVKCLVITGKGRAFSSGGDVNEMAEHSPKAGELFYKLTDQIHSSFTAILRMKKPVINALNGIIATMLDKGLYEEEEPSIYITALVIGQNYHYQSILKTKRFPLLIKSLYNDLEAAQ